MILDNKMPVRQGRNKYTHVITIKKKNQREIKTNQIIKSVIVKELQFPINNKIRTSGNSHVVTIPTYLLKNKLLKKGTLVDKIQI